MSLAIMLSPAEAELCRQWFDSVQDLNPAYLTPPDFVLVKRLYDTLGMRVPHSVLDGAKTPR